MNHHSHAQELSRQIENRDAEIERLRAKLAAKQSAEPVAVVNASDDGLFAEILPNVSVKIGQQLYAHAQPVAAIDQLTEFAKFYPFNPAHYAYRKDCNRYDFIDSSVASERMWDFLRDMNHAWLAFQAGAKLNVQPVTAIDEPQASGDAILPCPFCGSAPDFPSAADTFGTCYEAGCTDCGIATLSLQIIDCFEHPRERVRASWNEDTHQYGWQYIDEARRQAIELWQARAKLNAQQEPKK